VFCAFIIRIALVFRFRVSGAIFRRLDTFSEGAYLYLLLEGGTQIFSLIQAQNLQVKLLVIFISGESLIFVFFFFILI
jgi:hypothetical protein